MVVAVHSSRSKARGARHLGFSAEQLAVLDGLLRANFDVVEQHDLDYADAFTVDARPA
ncbi:hypothetical protein GCM10011608_44450 [Micromonospora sonchi]|uniref:Uncharacterized protein n=2 Tax=Micromonospora sonchi TaxID=1763543 RepID=A0A917X218_9ACTN|nr:hypothetical protein GCM10011608_44450 [Micromonospora sonchi]